MEFIFDIIARHRPVCSYCVQSTPLYLLDPGTYSVDVCTKLVPPYPSVSHILIPSYSLPYLKGYRSPLGIRANILQILLAPPPLSLYYDLINYGAAPVISRLLSQQRIFFFHTASASTAATATAPATETNSDSTKQQTRSGWKIGRSTNYMSFV